MMKRHEFFNLVEGLFNYYQYTRLPAKETINDWFDDVKHIDSRALGFIKSQLRQHERIPVNIPLAIKGNYSHWKRRNLVDTEIKYNKIEDLRFPVEHLKTAYDEFKNRGMAAMMRFCKSVNMPERDVARVVHTCKKNKDAQRDEAQRLVDGLAETKKMPVVKAKKEV